MTRRIIAILAAALLLAGCGSEPAKQTPARETARPASSERKTEVRTTPTPKPRDEVTFDWTETPGSSCFSWVGYDGAHEKLAVIFRSSESRTYVYNDFSRSDYRAFMAADSLGSYYNKNIKGQYSGTRIDDAAGTVYSPKG